MSGFHPEYRPFRLEVEGFLRLEAPLHVGGAAQWSPGLDAPVYREGGLPIIPGTSVRGVVRHHLLSEHGLLGVAQDSVERLFGGTDPPGTDNAQSMHGRLRIFDCLPQAATVASETRDYTRHDLKTGAAGHGGKFDAEAVLPRTAPRYSFRMIYEGESAEDPELVLVQEALRALCESDLRLGAHSGKGFGRIMLESGYSLRAYDRSETEGLRGYLQARLQAPAAGQPFEFPQAPSGVCESTCPPVSRLEWTLELQFDGPVIVRAPIPPAPDPQAAVQPDHVYLIARDSGSPYLPGASLRGVLRAQAHRIAQYAGREDAWKMLFGTASGDTGQRGCLEIGDGELIGPARHVYLDHVALDRITQFPVDKAKFSFCALASPRFQVRVALRVTAQQLAAVALWRFLQRDLEQWRLAAGGAVTRGYGWIRQASVSEQRHALVTADWGIPGAPRRAAASQWCAGFDKQLDVAWGRAQ